MNSVKAERVRGRLLVAAVPLAMLSACGGGASNPPPSRAVTPPPSASATPAPAVAASPPTTTPTPPTPTATTGSPTPAASTMPVLNVVSVTPDDSSVKVVVSPYPGAADYRISNVAKPGIVKYAGMRQTYDGYGNHTRTFVNPELEANGLDPGASATYVIEAVDALGPTGTSEATLLAYYNTYTAPAATFPLGPITMPMPAPGSNEQATSDGNTSTNGQGSTASSPHVIARSQPFTVTALTAPVLPTAGGTQTFFDGFPNSEGDTIARTYVDANATMSGGVNGKYAYGNEKFSMGNWQIQYGSADILNSYPFVMAHHFMDVLFDGATPGTNAPPGVAWSWMSLTPNPAADFSNAILHATMEVDCEQHGRRFASFGFEPHGDPIVSYAGIDAGEPANLNVDGNGTPVNLGVDVQFGPGSAGMTQAIGGTHGDNASPPDGKVFPNVQQIIGNPSADNPLVNDPQSQQSRGIDDRCREDVFLADTKPMTEYALYQDGGSVISNGAPSSVLEPLSIPITWAASADVHFYHAIYHTNLENQEIAEYTPWETFWEQTVQDSDERHWNNMGFEVLPMSELDNLAAHAQPAKPQPPAFAASMKVKARPIVRR